MIKKIMDKYKQPLRFLAVGMANTLVGYVIMQIAYHIFHTGYWGATISAYLIGSIFSFFANKNFTFEDTQKNTKAVVKYVFHIMICYIIAYGMARNLAYHMVGWINSDISSYIKDQIAMLCGMGLYTVFNFIGQKKLVFASED